MAKKKAVEVESPTVEAVVSEVLKFRVSLSCPTPLAFNSVEIEADDEEAAWNKFCQLNGISGSDHARTIEGV
jgi:hypothetical protein